ncbi:MAG TPA: glutathione S-transferase family protein [Solirubrobacteraceae bacterium]|nr:glutathione S-transferase family protein [Solirubrobacteraceae bacterium]
MAAPVLWHLKASHYNEKARWALDHKRVPHSRRAVTPGTHPLVAKVLTRGETFPILVLDGRAVGDSSAIIAELERRYPDRPLYPSDPDERRRALELEEFFDEELGPYSRMLVMHHSLPDPDLWLAMFAPDVNRVRRAALRAAFPRLRAVISKQFALDGGGVERAFDKIRAAGERFRAEVGPSGHLVGDRFTVADLTLAALLSPPVAPDQFPYAQPQRGHPLFAPVHEALEETGLLEWTRETYARHRHAQPAQDRHTAVTGR